MSDNENRQLEQLFGGNKRIKATLEQACGFSNKTSATDDAQGRSLGINNPYLGMSFSELKALEHGLR